MYPHKLTQPSCLNVGPYNVPCMHYMHQRPELHAGDALVLPVKFSWNRCFQTPPINTALWRSAEVITTAAKNIMSAKPTSGIKTSAAIKEEKGCACVYTHYTVQIPFQWDGWACVVHSLDGIWDNPAPGPDPAAQLLTLTPLQHQFVWPARAGAASRLLLWLCSHFNIPLIHSVWIQLCAG